MTVGVPVFDTQGIQTSALHRDQHLSRTDCAFHVLFLFLFCVSIRFTVKRMKIVAMETTRMDDHPKTRTEKKKSGKKHDNVYTSKHVRQHALISGKPKTVKTQK